MKFLGCRAGGSNCVFILTYLSVVASAPQRSPWAELAVLALVIVLSVVVASVVVVAVALDAVIAERELCNQKTSSCTNNTLLFH